MTAAAGALPDPREQPFMRVEHVAAAFDISTSSTYEQIHTGVIPSIRVGRRLRVPTAAVWRLAGLNPDIDEPSPATGEGTVTTDDRNGPGHASESHIRAV